MKESPESRSPVAAAMALASQITTVAAEMALPPLGGFWLDRWLGTRFLFVALGAALGLYAGMVTILRIGGGQKRSGPTSSDPSSRDPQSTNHSARR